MLKLNKEYWKQRYRSGNTQWDIGKPSPQLIQLAKKYASESDRILIPGAGRGHEYVKLKDIGFQNVYLCDWANEAFDALRGHPMTNDSDLMVCDFFELSGNFDLILEMTFFCALEPSLRKAYVRKCYDLLNDDGLLCGLWFDRDFNQDGPPFGGSREEYTNLLFDQFDILKMETASLSIAPRANKEVMIVCQRR